LVAAIVCTFHKKDFTRRLLCVCLASLRVWGS
jgi:hypothetical protein